MIHSTQEPLISIIIPCYNYAHFLSDCFHNLLTQSYTNWECILVDNASTDNTKQIIEGISQKDSRFKYLYQSIKGPSAARNMGILAAKGDFIQFLDADDLLMKDKFLSAISIFLKDPQVDIVYSDMRYFADNSTEKLFYSYDLNERTDQKWMSYVSGKRAEVLPDLLKGNIMVISSPLIKKASLLEIGLFDENLAYNEDWDLWIRFALENKLFHCDLNRNAMTLIRVHHTSHSRNTYKMYYCGLYVSHKLLQKLKTNEKNVGFLKKITFHEYNVLKLLLTLESKERLSEFKKYVDLLNSNKVIYKLVENMPDFLIKTVLLMLKLVKYTQYRFF
jgi:glycosyltransferase involved in cell wall biosynthesis